MLQRVLWRIVSSPRVRRLCGTALDGIAWSVEGGQGAGLRIRTPQNLDYVAGTSEVPVQQELARYLGLGGVFYDIGANVGFFSLLAARLVGSGGTVCAFEPVRENAEAIRSNACLNRFDRVIRVLEVAAGKSEATAEFLMTEWDGGGSLSPAAVRPEESVSRRMVRVVSLDAYIAEERLPAPTFVKIDVEGFEVEAIDGMVSTIERCMPILLYEVDDATRSGLDHRWEELDARVAGFGYRIRRLKESYPNRGWFVGHSLALPPSMANPQ
jgi:FkbM family methyltransferase